ncbi:methionine synthase [Chloroflexota bacterium]
MAATEFDCLPTIIGSMPHTDPQEASSLITEHLKDIPVWPQLPRRSFREHMCVQYSEGFPGVVVNMGDERIFVESSGDLAGPLEEFYTAYMENNIDKYPTSADYATGLYDLLNTANLSPQGVKGQITGPVTWGMTVTHQDRRAIIYDETFSDVVAKFLRLKASWQEKELRRISKNTLIFVDEPYMSAFGSVGCLLTREQIISLLEEVFQGLSGLKGIHCCGNTDWSILLETSADIISFDAYNYAPSLALYLTAVRGFLAKGGAIAWGIIPNNAEALAHETAASLQDRLEEAMSPFTRHGVRHQDLITQGLLTPACGLALMAPGETEQVFELLVNLSARIRKRYR